MLVDRGREEGQLKVQESDTKKGEIRVQPGGGGKASAVSEKQRNTVIRGKRSVRSRKVSQDRVRSGQVRVEKRRLIVD